MLQARNAHRILTVYFPEKSVTCLKPVSHISLYDDQLQLTINFGMTLYLREIFKTIRSGERSLAPRSLIPIKKIFLCYRYDLS